MKKIKIGSIVFFIISFFCFSGSLCSINKEQEPSKIQFDQESVDGHDGSKHDVVSKRESKPSLLHRLLVRPLTAISALIGVFLSLIVLGFIKRKADKCPRCGKLVHNEYGNSYKSAFCPHCGFRRT
ncbi:MAG: hypothetical protein EHM45_14355 [Desulfobacteraceae bacterium]|nr:MAG: hypothetical protein EHM45_14355 [Desulfobacteraceae bacterium]